MDKLAEALAEAIHAGAAVAPSALLGYYVVRVVDAIAPVIGFIGVVSVIGVTVLKGMRIAYKGGE